MEKIMTLEDHKAMLKRCFVPKEIAEMTGFMSEREIRDACREGRLGCYHWPQKGGPKPRYYIPEESLTAFFNDIYCGRVD